MLLFSFRFLRKVISLSSNQELLSTEFGIWKLHELKEKIIFLKGFPHVLVLTLCWLQARIATGVRPITRYTKELFLWVRNASFLIYFCICKLCKNYHFQSRQEYYKNLGFYQSWPDNWVNLSFYDNHTVSILK